MILARDKSPTAPTKEEAYSFQQSFNKTVIVKASDFPPPPNTRKRSHGWSIKRWLEGWERDTDFAKRQLQQSDWNQTFLAQPGDRPWYCYWNGTILSGYIYISESYTPSPLGPPQQYPKMIRIREKRHTVNTVAPYCQQVQVLDNYRLSAPLNTVLINETETPYPHGNGFNGGNGQVEDDDDDDGGPGQRRMQRVRRMVPGSGGPRCACEWENM